MDREQRLHDIAAALLPAILQNTQDGRGVLNASLGHAPRQGSPDDKIARAAWGRALAVAEICLDEQEQRAAERTA